MSYESIVFLQGDDYVQAMDETHGDDDALFDYLKRWETGEGSTTTEFEPWGSADVCVREGSYILSKNHSMSYVALTRELQDAH